MAQTRRYKTGSQGWHILKIKAIALEYAFICFLRSLDPSYYSTHKANQNEEKP